MPRYPRVEIEPDVIRAAIRETSTVVEAARMLGINPVTLWKLRKAYGIPIERPQGE